ncbi:NADH-quinone oxidoreductase subunit L [Thiocystis minor]|uniref:NADH-quinone oxidoreductase subunit 5 family protein n=1 Tax=Thiocystis minor TaxID=61597 RepID=UPI001F5CE7CC|nr:proton-conducting transporter membrane subunit [Thiocystis minor]
MLASIAYLLPLLGLISALTVLLLAPRIGERVARLSVGFSLVIFVVALGLFSQQIFLGQGQLATLGISLFTIHFDALTALMALAVSAISLVVHLYSVRYMREDPAHTRFFVLLDGINAMIMLMVLAGDLLTLLLAWHSMGVILYFLLNHDTRREAANRYAFWTLITHRIGDLPLMAAAALLYSSYGTLSIPVLFEAIAADPDGAGALGLPVSETVGLLILLAAFAKSAQFPFHTWLPYTMEGPTPVSALMHAGIVNAGGFLINRFAPVFAHTDSVLQIALLVGLTTTLMGSVMMLMQSDIKRSLGYSTMGQMGYMVMECGLGAFSLAIFHLIAHGIFKATLFLDSGSLIGRARRDSNIPEGEIYQFMVERRTPRPPLSWIVFAGITIAVPLAIVVSAHQMIDEGFLSHQGAMILLLFGWITGAQTLFFVYKIGGERPFRLLGYVVLSFALVILGYVLAGHMIDTLLYPDPAFREAIYDAASLPAPLFTVLMLVLVAAIAGAWLLVFRSAARREPLTRRYRNGYLSLYAWMSREFYVADLHGRLASALLARSRRLNALLRWV